MIRLLLLSRPFKLRKHTGHLSLRAQQCERTRFSPKATSEYDWIGTADRLSNLRPVLYHIPEKEAPLERKLRHLRQETEDWSHELWTYQNFTFSKPYMLITFAVNTYIMDFLTLDCEKSNLIAMAKGLSERDDDGRKRTLSREEMAVFYKHFFDKNITRHASYNREWFRRNFTITLLMVRVALHNTWRTLTGQTKATG